MVTFIKGRDRNNICSRSQEDLANEVGVIADTISVNAAKLEQWGMIQLLETPRSAYGSFAGKRYQLCVDRADVRALVAYYDPRGRDQNIGALDPTGSPPRTFREEPEIPDGKIKSPEGISAPPCQQIGCGAYRESRAGVGASKIIYHSLPEDHGIEDEELIDQVKRVLAVCGEGTIGVPTWRLVDSLAHHIPRALEEGYDFKQDIIACIRFYTQNPRTAPLNRFDVTFRNDLPKWRRERLKLKASKSERAAKTTGARVDVIVETTPKHAPTSWSPSLATDEEKQRTLILSLLNRIENIDTGQHYGWILNGEERDLPSDRRAEAFSQARGRMVAELRALGHVVADDDRSTGADQAEPLHSREVGASASDGMHHNDYDE